MLISYLSLAIRRIMKERMYSVIKITGLSVALSCLFLIYLFVSDEHRYDHHNVDAEQLYRIVQMPDVGNESEPAATTPFPLFERLMVDYPNLIESGTRFFNQRAPKISLNYQEKDIQFNETRFFFADSTVFDLFDVTFVRGSAETALRAPDGLVMTTDAARRYFGDDDPIGKTIRVEGRFNLTVSGIIEPIPATSHIQFDILGAFHSANGFYVNGLPDDWVWNIVWTYVRVKEGVSKARLDQALRELSTKIQPIRDASPIYYESQPVLDIRLNSNLSGEIGVTSSRLYITIVSYVGLFILLIASVNFINLSLASSMGRSREVGVRKVLGADRGQLIFQHLIEALLISVVSLLIAFVLIIALLPVFNTITGKLLTVNTLLDLDFWLFASAIVLSVTLIAGIYPALVMSSWSPMTLFKSGTPGKSQTMLVSNGLVVVQFAVASMLIAGTWTVFNQIELLRNQRLGFEQEQVVMIPTAFTRLIFYFETYHEQVTSHPQVLSATGISSIIGTDFSTYGYQLEGYNAGNNISLPFYYVTFDAEQTFGLELAAGRFFDIDFGTDWSDGVIVNEALVSMAGWGSPEQAIGKEVRRDDGSKRVIGVVRNFNFSDLRKQIEPLVLEMPPFIPTHIGYMGVKLAGTDHREVLAFIRQRWEELDPTRPFEYFYLDTRLQQQYDNEQRLAEVSGFFSVISIIISCIGLFGLASYSTQRKSKTIGIRKVLGASVSNIVLLLSGEFIRLVLIANVFALPAIYWLISQWLKNFAYRVEVSIVVLGITFLITLIIAFATVSLQTLKAANRNPIESLRYE
jgi:putative ABC transport system permease protein